MEGADDGRIHAGRDPRLVRGENPFHAGLPPEEQALLESVFALAAEAAGQSDTTGHIANPNAAPIVGGAAAARFAKFDYYLKAINVSSYLKIEP